MRAGCQLHSIWCTSVKRSVRPRLVVERRAAFQALLDGAAGLLGVEIHFLVFDTLPEAFDEHVIAPVSLPVHANLDALVLQEPRELLAGELAPLVSIEPRYLTS